MTRTTLLTLLLVIAAGAVGAQDTLPNPPTHPDNMIAGEGLTMRPADTTIHLGISSYRWPCVKVYADTVICPDTLIELSVVRRMIDSAIAEEVGKLGKWRMELWPCSDNGATVRTCTTWTWVRPEGEP